MERKAVLEVLVPAGTEEVAPLKAAVRPATLEGKKVALHWNEKPGGEFLLAAVKEELSARYKGVDFVYWPKGTAWKADIENFAKRQPADAAIVSVGD